MYNEYIHTVLAAILPRKTQVGPNPCQFWGMTTTTTIMLQPLQPNS